MATIYHAVLLAGIVLTARLCKAHGGVGFGDGFSVEIIHRDSVKSPYHDPTLSAHARVLAAVRRSTARAAALARSYTGSGAVSEVVSKPFEYLMVVNIGTPPTRMLAILDTGSNLVWIKCKPYRASAKSKPQTAAGPLSAVFDPSSSSTYGWVNCYSSACRALRGASCDATYSCQYLYSYLDGARTSGILSTETFNFDIVPGGCKMCRDRPNVQVPKVNFGCSTSASGTLMLVAEAIVGLGPGDNSLITQLGTGTALGRRFSYCMVPYFSKDASSALNFGGRAAVTEPGAATIPLMLHTNLGAYYTVVMESVKIGNSTFQHLSNLVIDSGTSLTFLDKGLIDQIVEDLRRRIGLPTVQSPDKLVQLCYSVKSFFEKYMFMMRAPDVTLYLGGEAVTLKTENAFVEVQEGTMCLAMSPMTEQYSLPMLGNIAQQNMHVGYDIDKMTITFAPADCTSSYNSLHAHG